MLRPEREAPPAAGTALTVPLGVSREARPWESPSCEGTRRAQPHVQDADDGSYQQDRTGDGEGREARQLAAQGARDTPALGAMRPAHTRRKRAREPATPLRGRRSQPVLAAKRRFIGSYRYAGKSAWATAPELSLCGSLMLRRSGSQTERGPEGSGSFVPNTSSWKSEELGFVGPHTKQ